MTTGRTEDEKPPTKFRQRREATRSELLELGFQRFPVKGYAATTVEDLVRNSGYTRGAFYFHFESKESFFLAVLQWRATLREGWWRLGDDELASLEGGVAAALARLGDSADDSADIWAPLIVEFAQAVKQQPEHRDSLASLHATWLEEMGLLFEEFRARNLLRTDLPVSRLAEQVLAYVDGVGMHAVTYRIPLDPGVVHGGIVRLLRP